MVPVEEDVLVMRDRDGFVIIDPSGDEAEITIAQPPRSMRARIYLHTLFKSMVKWVKEGKFEPFTVRRITCEYYDACRGIRVPEFEFIAEIIELLAGVLAEAPQPEKRFEEEGGGWLWSPAEADTSKWAAEQLRKVAEELRSAVGRGE